MSGNYDCFSAFTGSNNNISSNNNTSGGSPYLTPMEDIKLWQFCGMSGMCGNPCSTLPHTNSLIDDLNDDDNAEESNSRHSNVTPINQDDLPTDECNYDISPTQLYHCIETRRFQLALTILKSATPEQKNGQSPSGRKQANTWVYRKKPPIRNINSDVKNDNNDNNDNNGDSNNSDILWRHMPLHAAIIHSAPSSLISSLLKYSPPSAKCRDETGMLPLHFAFRKDESPDTLIVEMLLAAYPDGANVLDDEGRLPHQCATSLTAAASPTSTATTAVGGGVMAGCVVPSAYCDLRSSGERRSTVEMMEAKLDRIKNDYEDRIAKSLKEHEAMHHDWNQTLMDCRTSHEDKMKQVHTEREALLTKQRAEHDEKVLKLKELLEAANSEMERLRRLVQDSSDAVAVKMEEKEAEISKIRKERTQFEAQAQKLKDIIIRLEGSLSDSASANNNLQNRVAQLASELDEERRRLAIVTREKEEAEGKLIIEETERAEITKLVKEWKETAKKREEEERAEAQRLALVEKEMEGKQTVGGGVAGSGGGGPMVIGPDDSYGCHVFSSICVPFSQ